VNLLAFVVAVPAERPRLVPRPDHSVVPNYAAAIVIDSWFRLVLLPFGFKQIGACSTCRRSNLS
jgi:hypothetical protein